MTLIRNLKGNITITAQGPLSLHHLLGVRAHIMDLQTQFSLAQSQVKLSMQMVLFIMGQWSGTNSNMFPFSLYCQGPQGPTLTSRPPQVPEST